MIKRIFSLFFGTFLVNAILSGTLYYSLRNDSSVKKEPLSYEKM